MPCNAVAQFDNSLAGIYTTPFGNGSKYLFLFSDSTYQLVTEYDLLPYPIDPIDSTTKWTLDAQTSDVILFSQDADYPDAKTFTRHNDFQLKDDLQRVWSKHGDIYLDNSLKRYIGYNGKIISFNQRGFPVTGEVYNDGILIQREHYFDLNDSQSNKLSQLINKLSSGRDPIVKYKGHYQMAADFYSVVQMKEENVRGNWVTTFYDENGKRVKREKRRME